MRALRDFLSERSLVELAVAFGLGYALIQLCSAIAGVVLGAAWPQPAFDVLANSQPTQPYTFTIGNGIVFYGGVLQWLLALVLATLVVWGVVRALGFRTWREDELRDYPHCLGRIPVAAAVCEYCTREVA